jgi:hypothetical protein
MSMGSNSASVLRAVERQATGGAIRAARKAEGGRSFSKLVHVYFQSPQYAKLSPLAVKLLVDLTAQYRGTNNGDLTTAWSVLKAVGWRSKALLYKAQQELEQRGWIVKTRQGVLERGKHTATLWALTFEGINDCGKDKRDPGIKPDTMPLNLWRLAEFDTPRKASGRGFRKKVLVRLVGTARPESRGGEWPHAPYSTREPGRKCA